MKNTISERVKERVSHSRSADGALGEVTRILALVVLNSVSWTLESVAEEKRTWLVMPTSVVWALRDGEDGAKLYFALILLATPA